MSGQGTESTDGVHHLTRLSSREDFVTVVDQQACPVLTAETRIEMRAQSRNGLFHELYRAVKSVVLPAEVRPSFPTTAHCPDTSDWDYAEGRNEDYIDAKHAAEAVHRDISQCYPQISGHMYAVRKFKIVQSQDQSGAPVQDYYLMIKVDATPNLKYIFAQVRATERDGLPHLSLVPDYLSTCS